MKNSALNSNRPACPVCPACKNEMIIVRFETYYEDNPVYFSCRTPACLYALEALSNHDDPVDLVLSGAYA